MDMQEGQPTAFHQMYSDDDLVILQVERFKVKGRQTFVFDGYDSMEKAMVENPDIPESVWHTLTEMQSELNAAMAV
jgi:hypothetical protein